MLFRLDFQSDVPIYKQLRDQVVLAVAGLGTLPHFMMLLKSEGYLVTDRRNGAVVCAPPGSKCLSDQQLAQLRLLAGEAKAAGLSQEEFLAQCKAAFSEMEG